MKGARLMFYKKKLYFFGNYTWFCFEVGQPSNSRVKFITTRRAYDYFSLSRVPVDLEGLVLVRQSNLVIPDLSYNLG
jgi:hypothetical protein